MSVGRKFQMSWVRCGERKRKRRWSRRSEDDFFTISIMRRKERREIGAVEDWRGMKWQETKWTRDSSASRQIKSREKWNSPKFSVFRVSCVSCETEDSLTIEEVNVWNASKRLQFHSSSSSAPAEKTNFFCAFMNFNPISGDHQNGNENELLAEIESNRTKFNFHLVRESSQLQMEPTRYTLHLTTTNSNIHNHLFRFEIST